MASSSSSHSLLLISLLTASISLLLQTQLAFSALIITYRNHHNQHHSSSSFPPRFQTNRTNGCALFQGSWVRDDSYPLYSSSTCSFIDRNFNCEYYGRPDFTYPKYRWQPLGCELPRFDGLQFLQRMSGKTVMFVGDSIGRNQFESLVCMIMATVPKTANQMNGGDPLSTVKFLVTVCFLFFLHCYQCVVVLLVAGHGSNDYGVTISFYKTPYLVDIGMEEGKRVLKLDDISNNANVWRNADVLYFNTGHWWNHQGSLQGWEYMETGGNYYKDMDRLTAMDRAIRTWGNWVDNNIDHSTTRVFFLSTSPTHYDPSEWSSGATAATKNCYGETSPVSGTTYPGGVYPDQLRVLEGALQGMKRPPYLMDITLLSGLRKDAHPSIYSGDLSPQQKANPLRSADCSHWCLPGLPDTWNQLLYTALFF
ncbi:Protein PMR5 [Linum perenne]